MKSIITFSLVLFTALLANAQVEFEEHVVIDPALYVNTPNSVVSADLDGDGDKDVLTSSYYGNRLVWLENLNGLGDDVALHVISSTIQTAWGVYTADLDGDDDLDVVVASLSGNGLTWYENTDGNGTFVLKQATYAYQPNLVMAADMDNDTDLDLVWSSKNDGTINWIRNSDGLGTFATTFNLENNVSSVMSFYPADMDGDGDNDIVSCYATDGGSHGVTWYKNNGFGIFGSKIVISNAVDYVTSVYAGDLDGDGDMDVVSASGGDDKIAWYKNLDGIGTFGAQQVLSLTADAAAVVRIADVDGDNDKDVIFGSNDDKTIGWFKNIDGMGNFSSETFIAPNSGDIRDIYFSDMDADGDLDFLTASNIDNNIKLFKNTDGTGNFASSILTKHIDGGRIVVADDLDGDGDKDIIAASYWDDKISWFKNLDGQGNFYNSQTIISATINGASSVFVGDVNGDGFKDVLTTSYIDNTVVWYKNTDGLGTFAAPQIIDANLYQSSRVYLSDIDNDGDLDVFALGSTKIAWYKNLDGQGSFSTPQTIDNINNFTMYDMSFGDLDSDGDLDISVAGTYGMMRYLNINGQGTFGTRLLIETSNHKAVSTKITDIDGDGDNDLVYIGYIGTSATSSFVGWSENMNGLGSFGSLQIISTILSTPKSVIVADFDNDGDMDVASSAQGDGGVIAWYENTDGQGTFANTQQIISQTSNSPFDLFAADIDNNNRVDIVSISNFDDKISWHKNLGVLSSNSISGTVRFDLLGDGCTDTDALVSGILLVATDNTTTNATFSQENGQFQIYTTEEGLVTTQLTSQLPTYYAATPVNFESNFTGLGNSDNVNFCIAPIATINDLSVSVYQVMNNPRPGFMTGYRIVYKNTGTTQLSGDVSFEFDASKLNFLNATENIASQTSNTLTFNFTDLNPFETKTIDLRFNVFVPPTTSIGDVLIAKATINPVVGDFTPQDNVIYHNQVVVGSLDPNDITCLEGDQVLIGDADKYLHYLIRFQNTGTADAVNVRVDNILDNKLDWTTMQLESLSHPGSVSIRNGSEVSFVFNNMNLPDSTNDEPNSHGFIAYKIKPKGDVEVGDIINATAAIYFDFNPPVVTNTESTEFVETLSAVDFKVDKVSVYPNPTNGVLNIVSNVSINSIEIYNHLGQLMLSDKNTSRIDVSSLSQGVYLMTLKDVSGATHTKMITKR
ncbi:T9SS type A sorting domain-containing protein [Flavobacterium sp. SM15]|uniref:T9SS type A sorting domain-containing protein n=1 Tax=Flavobacterium sp. SM15 TaxID=2908005 RepID=UPI001EDAE6F4|nr:T9SS type A sorting domain-containing protein [Flavobacterium sp. SM15]MCG2611992.1 T9SS type A sorting domain-containing protein [Flavobacterium sp. SM15]